MTSIMNAIVWRIWKCRNDVVFWSKNCDHGQAIKIPVKESNDFLEAQERSSDERRGAESLMSR